MARNRVEELESKVAELESTVQGLTEELVEANERIRDLEAELEPEPASGSGFEAADRRRVVDPEEFAEEFDAPEGADRVGEAADDAGETASGVDTDKNEDHQTEDERTESDPGDDIIIA